MPEPEAAGSRVIPLRMLLFIDGLGSGGAQRQFTHLAIGLARRGHRVSVAVYNEQDHFADQIKAAGIATSLDTAHVDVDTPAGQIDWRAYLARVLPHVDFFLPSLDEIFFMLERERFQAMAATMKVGAHHAIEGGIALLQALATTLLDMGVAVVGLKLGEQGIYLRTTDDPTRLHRLGKVTLSESWLNRELLAPAFAVETVGTTGAGDCAVAGFLAALLRGLGPEAALTAAAGAGACNVEVADAISGIPTWETLQARIYADWPRRQLQIPLAGWQYIATSGLWHK